MSATDEQLKERWGYYALACVFQHDFSREYAHVRIDICESTLYERKDGGEPVFSDQAVSAFINSQCDDESRDEGRGLYGWGLYFRGGYSDQMTPAQVELAHAMWRKVHKRMEAFATDLGYAPTFAEFVRRTLRAFQIDRMLIAPHNAWRYRESPDRTVLVSRGADVLDAITALERKAIERVCRPVTLKVAA